MTQYVATIRASFDATDDAAAEVIAEVVRENASIDFEAEDNAIVEVTDVLQAVQGSYTKQETVDALRIARNALIKLRKRRMVDVAKELDLICWVIEHDALDVGSAPGYDYGRFVSIVDQILKGENPDA